MLEPPTIFTIGHSNREASTFDNLLQAFAIDVVVDLRARPYSQRHPHFGRAQLSARLRRAQIDYLWHGETFGGFRTPKADSKHIALNNLPLRGFADHMESQNFQHHADKIVNAAASKRIVLMCAEAKPSSCHRQLIADYLTLRGARMKHIMSEREAPEHGVNAHARFVDDRLIYDRGTQALLL